MMEIFVKGGPIMYFILICSVAAVTIFINRVLSLHKAHINRQEFMAGLRNALKAKRITEAVSTCAQTPGPVANVLKAGIMNHDRGINVIKETMEGVSLHEISRMERGIPLLATIAVISPLLGFLGTILGLMNTFGKMVAQGGLLTGTDLASGIWQALFTTAFGLSVAIPVYLAYNYLVTRVERIVGDMEESATELVNVLTEEI